MQHQLKLQGNTSEEKLAHVERILNSFRRRLSTKVIAAMPPIIVLSAQQKPTATGGYVFRGLIPLSGRVKVMYLYIGKYITTPATFYATVITQGNTVDVSRSCSGRIEQFDVDFAVRAGDLVDISVSPRTAVEDILVSLLIAPDIREVVTEQYILDSLLQLEQQQQPLLLEADDALQDDSE